MAEIVQLQKGSSIVFRPLPSTLSALPDPVCLPPSGTTELNFIQVEQATGFSLVLYCNETSALTTAVECGLKKWKYLLPLKNANNLEPNLTPRRT